MSKRDNSKEPAKEGDSKDPNPEEGAKKNDPKASSQSTTEDLNLPTMSMPKSSSYTGPTDTTSRGRRKATASSKAADDEGETSQGSWKGRTRSSKPPEAGASKMSLFSRMRSKSKSKSPTKRSQSESPTKGEKSKSKSPAEKEGSKGRKSKSPSPHRLLYQMVRKGRSHLKEESVEEEQDEEEKMDEEESPVKKPVQKPMSIFKEAKNIFKSSTKKVAPSMTVASGSDTDDLLPTPADTEPVEDRLAQYKANLGQPDDMQTFIEFKGDKETPEEEETTSSSASVSSLVQGVRLEEDNSGGACAAPRETKRKRK